MYVYTHSDTMVSSHYFDFMLSFISLIQIGHIKFGWRISQTIAESTFDAIKEQYPEKERTGGGAFCGREDVLLAVKSTPLCFFFPFDPSIRCFSQYGDGNSMCYQGLPLVRSLVDSLFGWEEYRRPFRAKSLTCARRLFELSKYNHSYYL